MTKHSNGISAAGAALGLVAGAAIGVAGAYAVSNNSTQIKKTIKKMEKKAERAIASVDKMINK